MAYNYTNLYVMLFELTGIIIMLFISAHLSKNMKRSTGLTVGILLLLIAVHHLELWSQTIPDRYVLRFILTACKYSLYPVVMIVLMTIFSPFVSKANRKWLALLWIPEVVSVPIYFTSQWTGLVASFKIGEDHLSHYVGGGVLHFWPFMIFGLYLGLFVIANIIYLRRYSVRNRIILIFIFVGSVLGVILNLFFGDGDDYTPFFVSALLLYYLFLYIHTVLIPMVNVPSCRTLMMMLLGSFFLIGRPCGASARITRSSSISLSMEAVTTKKMISRKTTSIMEEMGVSA